MNVPVVSHLKLLVNLYNKMNNRFLVLLVIYLIIVAPLVGAWIEIEEPEYERLCNMVAPLVGTWIEILQG